MGTVSISDARTAPISEDLTTPEQRLNVVRGLDTMKRVDKPLAAGVSLELGEWAVLGADGKLHRPTTTPAKASYLVFCGTERYDVKATGQATIVMASLIVAETTRFEGTLVPGDDLTAKLLTDNQAGLKKAGAGDPVHARVVKVDGSVLTYSTTGV